MWTAPRPRKWLPGTVALVALALSGSSVGAEEELHPIAAQVKASLKDPAKPFAMAVILQVKDGMQEKFETAFAKALKATRKEKGNLTYDLNQDAKDSTRYVVYERWKNLAALDEHLKAPYLTTLLADLKEILAGSPDVKVMLPVGE